MILSLVFAFPELTFLPSGEILQRRPERSRARRVLGAAQRTLDGEDGSAIVRLGGKVNILSLQFVSRISSGTCDLPAAGSSDYCRHPSIRTRIELFLRSVQVGCSRFQPALQPVCRPLVHLTMERGQAIDAVTGTRRLNSELVVGCAVVLEC